MTSKLWQSTTWIRYILYLAWSKLFPTKEIKSCMNCEKHKVEFYLGGTLMEEHCEIFGLLVGDGDNFDPVEKAKNCKFYRDF